MTNIAELLKDCPKGTKLYSPLFGEVFLYTILSESKFITVRTADSITTFNELGQWGDNSRWERFPDAECLLFPSKEVRTWEGWKAPVEPKFKVGDWIVQNDNGTVLQITKTINGKDEYGECRAYEHTNGYFAACFENEYHLWTIQDAKDGDVITNGKLIVIFNKLEEPVYRQHIIAYVGLDLCGRLQITEDIWRLGVDKAMPATKKQRDMLFKKMREAGYQWDSDKKELCKIQPHYDIANFQPKQWVLVRDDDEWEWALTMFSYLSNGSASLFVCINGASFQQCIPFEGNEKLLGTTYMPSEEFINW